MDTSPFIRDSGGCVSKRTSNSLQDEAKKVHREEDDSVGAGSEVGVLRGGVVKEDELREAEVDAGGEEDGGDGDDDDLAVQRDE